MDILVIDDEATVRDAYRHLFEFAEKTDARLKSRELASELFSDFAPVGTGLDRPTTPFQVDYASQGLEGVALVESALKSASPYKVVFIDVRMPPGIDGKETARRIRMIDPDINIVMVTAFSDHSATDIAAVAGPADKIFYICKPFGAEEVSQMARALAKRWDHDTKQVVLLREKVAELAASEARARHMANHDFLTGAPNRLAFQRQLTERLQTCRADLVVAFMDLDRFKHVNDTFGHGAGDELLKIVYSVLSANAPEGALVARLGGDEFGLLFSSQSQRLALEVCAKLVEACSATFSVFGNSVHIGASCGIVECSAYSDKDAHDLLRYADLALFAAKRTDGQHVRLFDEELDLSQKFRQKIEAGLYQAIANDELSLHYQPIVERDTLDVIGYEALLRWTSAEHGSIPPGVFIPIAEEGPAIMALGDWVVEQAFSDARAWPGKLISINFSPRQFKRSDFVERMTEQAKRFGIEPERVQIEITETALFDNVVQAQAMVEAVRSHGFRIALDDFGTGYSSMFNLKNFSVDCIKIDRAFVDGMGTDNQSAAIVNAIAHLARGLGLVVVAEGVENAMQCQALRVVGCSHMQGYLFGRGKPASTIDHGNQVDAARATVPKSAQA